MSRDFNGTQRLLSNTVPVANYPMTMAAWFSTDDLTTETNILSVGASGATDKYWNMGVRGNAAGDPIFVITRTGSGYTIIDAAAGPTDTAWGHACAVFTSTADVSVFFNGGNEGTGTGRANEAWNRTTIGCGARSALDGLFNGRIAEAAIWNAALTNGEVAILALGYSPLFVRPASLVAYWPLIGRYDPEIDVRGISPMSITGATVGDHPRVLAPRRAYTPFGVSAPVGHVPYSLILQGAA